MTPHIHRHPDPRQATPSCAMFLAGHVDRADHFPTPRGPQHPHPGPQGIGAIHPRQPKPSIGRDTRSRRGRGRKARPLGSASPSPSPPRVIPASGGRRPNKATFHSPSYSPASQTVRLSPLLRRRSHCPVSPDWAVTLAAALPQAFPSPETGGPGFGSTAPLSCLFRQMDGACGCVHDAWDLTGGRTKETPAGGYRHGRCCVGVAGRDPRPALAFRCAEMGHRVRWLS
jgi:hypothetical protein